METEHILRCHTYTLSPLIKPFMFFWCVFIFFFSVFYHLGALFLRLPHFHKCCTLPSYADIESKIWKSIESLQIRLGLLLLFVPHNNWQQIACQQSYPNKTISSNSVFIQIVHAWGKSFPFRPRWLGLFGKTTFSTISPIWNFKVFVTVIPATSLTLLATYSIFKQHVDICLFPSSRSVFPYHRKEGVEHFGC